MKTLELLPPAETMYRALLNRDPSFEGIFYIGVRTIARAGWVLP
jgi:methylphosphotriester-DNA--protein-cysteine methyltransferase